MVNCNKIAAKCLNRLEAIAILIASFLYILVTCTASFFVGTIAVFVILGAIFVKLVWPVFLVLALLVGIGILLGVFVI